MGDILRASDLRSFTPFQHILQLAEPIETVDFHPSDCLEIQSSNVKKILTNALDVDEYRQMKDQALIPESAMKKMYNAMAQTNLEMKLQEMRGQKFEISYEEAPSPMD